MINQKIDYTIGFHREKAVIFIGFKIDNELIAWVKNLVGAKWSNSNKK